MIQARLSDRKRAPIWAVVGVPLVAVPMLVALLALAAPEGQSGEEAAGIVPSAPVEALSVGLEYDCGEVARPLQSS